MTSIHPELVDFHGISLHVQVDSATDMIQTAIGAHITQRKLLLTIVSYYAQLDAVSRGSLPEVLLGYTDLDHAWETLGMTPTSYSPGKTIYDRIAHSG